MNGVVITRVMERLLEATDAGAVGAAVGQLGPGLYGLAQCGVTWQRGTEDEPWWVLAPTLLDRFMRAARLHHGPVADDAPSDGMYKLVLPVVEPGGVIGAICCGHDVPFRDELRRDLVALAMHVSVRLAQLGTGGETQQALARLTPRQSDVALLAARGRPNAAIARSLGMSENTVKKHLKDIFSALAVANRTELANKLNRAGPAQVLRLVNGDR